MRPEDAQQLLENILQLDAAVRSPRHRELTGALRVLSTERPIEDVRAWARRAVDPSLGYSELNALHRYLPLRAPSDKAKPVRIAISGGPTTHQLRRLIEVFLAAEGIVAEIYEGDYGLFRQEILSPGSALDRFAPDILFLATGASDVARWPAVTASEAAAAAMAEDELADWGGLWSTARSRWNATVIQNNFEIAPGAAFGHFSLRHPGARENYLDRLNTLFSRHAPSFVLLHDLRGLSAELGASRWFDASAYHEFKLPCSAECLVPYAHSVMSVIRAIQGRSRKVLVLDLDNTLWGGVVGDLGPGGIKVGEGSGEGEAFLAFQRHAKQLRDRGVLLAVCSKNDEKNAREPFEKRSDMILRLEDFACFVANWQNKADNLRDIAAQLELKPDALVFADDNPAERALVRRLAPEVSVPDMPEDPAGYVRALATHRYFETVGFTKEDGSRGQYYAENARRRELQSRSTDLHSFLASLQMKMKVEPVHELNIERVTQLLNKSNQFNLTTRRLSLPQLKSLAADPDWRTLTFTLSDNLGDNGLISILLLSRKHEALDIDTWLMSCRVLQRGVEQFVRNEIVELCRREGLPRLTGTYIPTPKNGMVEQHYPGLGFESAGCDGGQTFWQLSVGPELQSLPHHIERV